MRHPQGTSTPPQILAVRYVFSRDEIGRCFFEESDLSVQKTCRYWWLGRSPNGTAQPDCSVVKLTCWEDPPIDTDFPVSSLVLYLQGEERPMITRHLKKSRDQNKPGEDKEIARNRDDDVRKTFLNTIIILRNIQEYTAVRK